MNLIKSRFISEKADCVDYVDKNIDKQQSVLTQDPLHQSMRKACTQIKSETFQVLKPNSILVTRILM